MYSRSAIRTPSSPHLLAELMTTRKATFIDRWVKEHEARGLNGSLVNAERTEVSSQEGRF